MILLFFVRKCVDADSFVVGIENREVGNCGRGECRCYMGLGI